MKSWLKMRSKKTLAVALASLSLSACVNQTAGVASNTATEPQIIVSDSGSKLTINGISQALSGTRTLIRFFHGALTPECALIPDTAPNLRITQQGQHGTLSIVSGNRFPVLPATSPFFKCDSDSLPSQMVFYTPQPGYVGTDFVSFSAFGTAGREFIFNWTIRDQ